MIGMTDNGKPKGLNKEDMLSSLIALCEMARANKSDVVVIKLIRGNIGKVAQVQIR